MNIIYCLNVFATVTISFIYGEMVIPRLPADVLVKGGWPPVDNRIAGGSPASPGEFPFQVSLQRSSGSSWSHVCGGSIYDNLTILTAGHCIDGASADVLRVVAGDYQLNVNDGTEQINSVNTSVIHPLFNEGQNDICLVKLKTPLTFNAYVAPISFHPNGTRPADGTITTVTGWGSTTDGSTMLSPILRKADIPIVSDDACKASYGANAIKPGMVCAGYSSGGVDSCNGDSGGPLVLKGTTIQVGIVSWGMGCAKPYYYGVYTDLSYYIEWIESNPSSASSPAQQGVINILLFTFVFIFTNCFH